MNSAVFHFVTELDHVKTVQSCVFPPSLVNLSRDVYTALVIICFFFIEVIISFMLRCHFFKILTHAISCHTL